MAPCTYRLVAGALTLWACGCKSEEEFNRGYVEKELTRLEAAFATGKETNVVTSCAVLEATVDKMPAPLVERVQRGCFVEAPKLILKNGIASVLENMRKYPDKDMVGLHCMELFIPGALETVAKHPTSDPALQKLVAEYTQLCPNEAAKARGSARP